MGKEYGDDYAADVKINRFKLAEECEQHVSLYQYYADELASIRASTDRRKDVLSLIEAQRELSIRKDPPEDSPKITEAVVKALVQSDERVIEAKNTLSAIRKEQYHLEAAVTALEHRKRMLDSLVQLLIAGFYSAPKTERKGNTEVADKGSKDVRKKLNVKNKDTGGKG